MSFLFSSEMSGKTCLPCLPRDVGEDIWGCWGRHLEMLGKTGTLGKTLKAIGEDIKEDGDDIGEVRDDEEDIREDGDDIREVGDDKEDIRDDLRDDGDDMSSLSSLRCRGSHVFPIFLEMFGKSCLPCLHLRCRGRHVFSVFLEMSGKACLPYLP